MCLRFVFFFDQTFYTVNVKIWCMFSMSCEQLTLRSHKKHELALSKVLRAVKINTQECLRDENDNICIHIASFSLFSACLCGLFNHALLLAFLIYSMDYL